MRVGLVLGAGGVLGGAWLTGGLHALARETDWDPGSAEYIVGTSAGSMIGALVAAGVPPWFMVAHSRGEVFAGLAGPDGRPASEADRAAGACFRVHRGLPPLGPGSLRLAATALSNPLGHTPLAAPRGVAAGRARLHRLAQGDGPPRGPGPLGRAPELLGDRLRLRLRQAGVIRAPRRTPRRDRGRGGSVLCDTGLLPPGEDRSRRYVDGGVCSASNLDLLAGRGLDLVICLNPLSSLDDPPLGEPARLAGQASRRAHGPQAGTRPEGAPHGTDVVLIQPTAKDLE